MEPFLGSAAIADGTLTRGVLRAQYTALLPNIYVSNDTELTLEVRARAAWLWSRRTAIIAGRTAAVMYRTPWAVNPDPVELIYRRSRRPPGLIVRNERIADDEIGTWAGLPVTRPVRTALDLARHLPRDEAVTLLDPLCAASGITRDDIRQLATRYRGGRGMATADDAISEIDPGAESPEETRVRLLLSDSGVRPTHSQIRVTDGFREAVMAMGWPDRKVGLDCNFGEFQRFPLSALRNVDLVHSLGWLHIQLAPGEPDWSICARVHTALWSRFMEGRRASQ